MRMTIQEYLQTKNTELKATPNQFRTKTKIQVSVTTHKKEYHRQYYYLRIMDKQKIIPNQAYEINLFGETFVVPVIQEDDQLKAEITCFVNNKRYGGKYPLPDRITYRKFVDYVQTAIMQSVFKLADVRYSKTEVLLRV
jgi:hypothetical protein